MDGPDSVKKTSDGEYPAREMLDSLIETGMHEINRGRTGLLLSAFSAGMDIGFGPVLMAVVLTLSVDGYGALGTELILASVYSVGFMFVIIGRSELFTEHTTLAVVPVIDGQASVKQLARLWSLVYIGNIAGGIVFTALAVLLLPGLSVATPESFETIALKLVNHDLGWLFVAGIFAGWLMGLLAWLISSTEDITARIVLIWIVTGTIGLLHLPHSIAGNVEVLFGLFVSSAVTPMDYIAFLALATVGNAVGGTFFVAIVKYGHVVRSGN